jgi:chromosome segregation ATPase
MEKKILPYLVIISAISVSLSAAFYSVTGIGKMFAGSATNVMIMMTSLEIAKLVLASLLFQYWDRLNALLKTYYFIAIFILMVITSGGIYGYLSSAYSETAFKLENIDKQVEVLNVKRKMFTDQLNDINGEKESISENIYELTKGLSNNTQSYKDKSGNILTTSSSANRKVFESQLSSSQKRRDELSLKESDLNSKINEIDLEILGLQTNSDVAAEIGPLKYISSLTGKSIDVVVNWFIIALMLVFDPLAVSLVVGANVIFRDKEKEKERKKLAESIEGKISDFEKREKDFEDRSIEFEERLNNLKKSEGDLENILKEKESLFEENVKKKEEEFNNRVLESEIKLNDLKKEEDSIKNRIVSEEYRLANLENDLLKEKEEVKRIKSQLESEKLMLNDDRMDINTRFENLRELEKEIKNREFEIEKSKEELMALDKEIREWESTHWRLRKGTRPPSAI